MMNLSFSEFKLNNNHSQKVKVLFLIMILFFSLLIILTPASNIGASQPRSPRQNQRPDAVIDSPENGDNYAANELVHFDASSSSDPDNDTLTYTWNFGDGESDTGVMTSHAYATPWVPIVRLTVSDGELNDTAVVVIVIGGGGGMNRPPEANITEPANGQTFTVKELITFDGSNSSDPDKDPISYEWDFGDGNKSTNMIAMHSYGQTGVYRVRLNVSDSTFNDSARVVIVVNNTPPKADAGGDRIGYLGQEMIFDGSASEDVDRFDSIVNYTWDLGDNSIKYGENITHIYQKYDIFMVKLTVTDENQATDTDEIEVRITNAPPVARLKINSPDTIINTDIEFDATDSYDIDGYIEEYSYNFGDGVETDWISLAKVEHKYRSKGKFQVTLYVRDDLGGISEPYFINITITEKVNQPPDVQITYPNDGDSVAGTITLHGTADDPDNNIEAVAIRIDDSSWDEAEITNPNGNSVSWEYLWDTEPYNDGEYVITARAWDGNKYSNEHSVSVEINNRPTTYIELKANIKPTKAAPGEEIKVSGTAMYDTDVPVKNTKVTIKIVESHRSWATNTDGQGRYSKDINAPAKADGYTISIYITDGTLEKEIFKTFTVLAPPDLIIQDDSIKFVPKAPKEKDEVGITATVLNTGEVAAFGLISFYLDSTDILSIFETQSIDVPAGGSVLVTATWNAKPGDHEIFVVISDVDPEEAETANNEASKSITVESIRLEEPEEKKQDNFMEQLLNLPTIYKYTIIGIIIFIIIIIVIAAAVTVRKKDKEPKAIKFITGPKKSRVRTTVAAFVIIFALLSVIMMAAALFTPWYAIRGESTIGENTYTTEQLYSFTNIEFKDDITKQSHKFTWEEAEEKGLNMGNTSNLYKTTQYITIAGLAMGLLFIIGTAVAIIKNDKKIAIIFGLLALIVCLIAPVYFMIQHPKAVDADMGDSSFGDDNGPDKSFSGYIEQEVEEFDSTLKIEWAGEVGFGLAIFGALFALLGFIFSFGLIKPKTVKFKEEKPVSEGMVVFRPLDEEPDQASTGATQVKFETIQMR